MCSTWPQFSSGQRCSALVKDDVTGRVLELYSPLPRSLRKHISLHYTLQPEPPLFSQPLKTPTIIHYALNKIHRRAQDTHHKHLPLFRLALPHTPNHTMHLLHASHTTAVPITALSIKRRIRKHTRRAVQQTIRSSNNDPPNPLLFLPQCAPRRPPTKRALPNRPLRPEARIPPTPSPRTPRHASTIGQEAR
jgi:hypothetical protein